ncbi:alkaline phosphatase family protein [Luteimonas viscosa]|uniref:Alkaline phosphatase family protein n=1 Tax=Luteimonas viscosa TaxID=1132694 RepID=A0A5D4XRG1_9GAMM|nr:ectonucleotide pyrophosphatase/phosphodiesterase [Luteimonas viscosa]TYT25320.1 alkaline phosphatase family protein [Luteimonas viscosa]
MTGLSRLFVPLCLFLLSACTTTPAPLAASGDATRALLLVSLDGVHPSYLARGDTPHLDRLAHEGVRAEWMNPSYPSLTFPNHYTIVTGLRPDRHGIVHNTMRDDALGGFWLANRDAVGDSRWWSGEPIWVGAENAGLATATLAWPGSEAPVAGVRPTRWHPFDKDRTIAARVDMTAGWLTEPAATRPRFATLYFEHPDSSAHAHGPRSAQLRATMREVDAAIGTLLARLEAAGVRETTDLVIVSDHGMAEVPEGQVVVVEDMADPTVAVAVTSGQVVGFRPVEGREAEAEEALLGRHAHHQCWRRHELPPRWRYGTHPRVPPIVCQMDKGWDALPRKYLARRPAGTRGSHGYDPAEPEMRAIFIASGPSFRRGVTLPAFDNVDVYPLLARLLGVPPAPHEGALEKLLPALDRALPEAVPGAPH